LDAADFWQHWVQHRIPFLWEIHKVHHSAEVLTPITALRVHPLSTLVSAPIFGLILGGTNGCFLYCFPSISVLSFAGMNVLLMLHYSIGVSHLQHSHVWLCFPKWASGIFVSPAGHMIHHSRDPRHQGKNMGFIFTFWDRLLGTFHLPLDAEYQSLSLGLDPHDQVELRSVAQQYVTPLHRWYLRMQSSVQNVRSRLRNLSDWYSET
jgi:sterol desaturase/sphingolipid hydroxylase (fatty acid hydroxylase superfamily)